MNVNRRIEEWVFKVFKYCLYNKLDDNAVVVEAGLNTYCFNKKKLEKCTDDISTFGILINNFSEGITLSDMGNLVDGHKWTVLNQYKEFLVALLEASNMVEYITDEEEKKIKFKRTV